MNKYRIANPARRQIIPSSNTTFLKLFNPAYEWNNQLNNYWNGKVYDIIKQRWLKSRRNGSVLKSV